MGEVSVRVRWTDVCCVPLSVDWNTSVGSRVTEKERIKERMGKDANRKSKKLTEGNKRRGNKSNNGRQQEGTKYERENKINYLRVFDESCSALDCHFF